MRLKEEGESGKESNTPTAEMKSCRGAAGKRLGPKNPSHHPHTIGGISIQPRQEPKSLYLAEVPSGTAPRPSKSDPNDCG